MPGGATLCARTAGAAPPLIRRAQVRFRTIVSSSGGFIEALAYAEARYLAKQNGDAAPDAVADQLEGVSKRLWTRVCDIGEAVEQFRFFRTMPMVERFWAAQRWRLQSAEERRKPGSVPHDLLPIIRRAMPNVDAALADPDAPRIVCNVADLDTGCEWLLSSKDEAGRRTGWRLEDMIETTSLPYYFRAGHGRFVDGGLLANGPAQALTQYDQDRPLPRVNFDLGQPDLDAYAREYQDDVRLSALIRAAQARRAADAVAAFPMNAATITLPLQRQTETKLGLPTHEGYAKHKAFGRAAVEAAWQSGAIMAWLDTPITPRQVAKPMALAAA